MKAVIQRVSGASVRIQGELQAQIGKGLVVLLGVVGPDDVEQADFLAAKTAALRIFEDEKGKLNRSLLEMDGDLLVVSNFTLCADARHGRRPSFTDAAPPDRANALYERFVAAAKDEGVRRVVTGCFGADMQVELCNDGPVTILLDTDQLMKH